MNSRKRKKSSSVPEKTCSYLQGKLCSCRQLKQNEQVRILLDSGSQCTYITKSLAEQLQQEKTEEIKVVTFGCETPKTVTTTQTKLGIQRNTGQHLDISANIVPFISGLFSYRR